jgi:class 3 adenylate cyclase
MISVLRGYEQRIADAFVGAVRIERMGDGAYGAFASAREAVQAAAVAQRETRAFDWRDLVEAEADPAAVDAVQDVGVRIGIHTGEVDVRGDNFEGAAPSRAARIQVMAAPGQALLSEATALLLDEGDLGELELHDLGVTELRGFDRPLRLFEIAPQGQRADHEST